MTPFLVGSGAVLWLCIIGLMFFWGCDLVTRNSRDRR